MFVAPHCLKIVIFAAEKILLHFSTVVSSETIFSAVEQWVPKELKILPAAGAGRPVRAGLDGKTCWRAHGCGELCVCVCVATAA
jgi:hypothetical protein